MSGPKESSLVGVRIEQSDKGVRNAMFSLWNAIISPPLIEAPAWLVDSVLLFLITSVLSVILLST